MRLRRLMRLPGLVAAALLLFGSTRGLLGGSECAQHSLLGGPAGHAEAPASDHQHHASQAADDEQHQAPCTCLDHCSACPVVALPGLRATVVVAAFEQTSFRPAAAVVRLAGRTPHQLPFATAPPAIA